MYFRSDLLNNLKIVDLSRIFTGPFATQILGDLGAQIIKIEPKEGDDTRYWGPPFLESNGISTYFAALNRNKESMFLDLKKNEDYEEFKKIVQEADIFVENYRPGVTKRLKIDYTTINKINPTIIYLSITGFGTGGPYHKYPSYDIISQAESGLMGITGTSDGRYVKVGIPIGDIAAGMYGVIGILAALYERTKSNEGKYVSTDLFGSLTSWLTYQSMNSQFSDQLAKPPGPVGTSHPNIVPYQSFMCSDNRHVVISIANDKLWKKFIQCMKDISSDEIIQELSSEQYETNAKRVNHRDILIPIIQKIFLELDSEELISQLREYKLPVGRLRTIEEVIEHPQLEYTNQLREISNNTDTCKVFLTPISFTDVSELEIRFPATKINDY